MDKKAFDSIFKPGEATYVEMRHDSWCKTLNGGTGSDCNCDPEIHSENPKVAEAYAAWGKHWEEQKANWEKQPKDDG